MLAAALATAGAASGCDAVVEPIHVAAGCPEQPLRGPSLHAGEPSDRLIDDFEDGDGWLAPVAARTGAWILGNDDTSGVVTAGTSSACAARGARAGHFRGAGFTDWGANWTAVFREANGGAAVGYDVRGYGGLSFWAAAGKGSLAVAPDGLPLSFRLPIGLTTVDVAWNGGVCAPEHCMDYYGTVVTLTERWQRFTVRFDHLAQGNWGIPQITMRREQAVGFIIWPDSQFDIWIDDVRFEP